MTVKFGITVNTAPAESALFNGVVKWHKLISGEMLEKNYGRTANQY